MSNIQVCRAVVHETFEVLTENVLESRAEFSLGLPRRGNLREALERLYPRLTSVGCYPALQRDQRGLTLYVLERKNKDNLTIYIVLAAMTFFTVFLSGLALSAAGERIEGAGGISWSPLAYTLGLLVPLLLHELGHWSLMRLYSTPSSLPYLVPAPPLQLGFLGTFGAVINLRWLPPSADALSLMAIAGPLAGYLAALPLAIYGLSTSVPAAELPEDTISLNLIPLSFVLIYSLFYSEGGYVLLSSLAFASYVVFFVTFLNLIPVAMLDGGHVVRGVAGARAHWFVSRAFIVGLVVLAILNPNFMLFALLALLLFFLSGGRHPGPALMIEGSGKVSFVVALLYGILFVLTIPLPV
ncbi:MAG: site-2 protease family protein [Acidilobaceae archaeon]|nr:site-2 protease family protein [Acidilobaceae archaeon]MCX8165959.1 site-2 protease family protein [Acidilobaceae archaeon]MDW7974602.1 site-2 protease family protein [Sulfolobales archaeon]